MVTNKDVLGVLCTVMLIAPVDSGFSETITISSDKPSRPKIGVEAVRGPHVRLKCTSNSTSVPEFHRLPMTYTWRKNGHVFENVSQTVEVEPRQEEKGTRYSCQAEEQGGLKSDISDKFYGLDTAYIVESGSGSTRNISCHADCRPQCDVRLWDPIHNTYVTGTGRVTLDVNVTGSHGWIFICSVNNVFGSVKTVSYKPSRPEIVIEAVRQNHVRLMCISNSTSVPEVHKLPMTYTWRKNGHVFEDVGQTVEVTFEEGARGTRYSCQAKKQSGLKSDISDEFYGPEAAIVVESGSGITRNISCHADCHPQCDVRLWDPSQNTSVTGTVRVTLEFNVSGTYERIFTCNVTNVFGSVRTASYNLKTAKDEHTENILNICFIIFTIIPTLYIFVIVLVWIIWIWKN